MRHATIFHVMALAVLLGASRDAQGIEITILAGDTGAKGIEELDYHAQATGLTHEIDILIPGPLPAVQNANLYVVALTGQPWAHDPLALGQFVHFNVAPGRINLRTNETVQIKTGIAAPLTELGNIICGPSVFEPFDPLHQPAIFTAGIVTDVGELSVQVSAAELNFQTDGPIICQALFQRLAPRAPQYGAQINYAGDRLEVYFDPAYTVTQGGIIFGTTSPSSGMEGELRAAQPGDLNGDGFVGQDDLNPILANWGLTVPPADELADRNKDGFVGQDDLNEVLSHWGEGSSPMILGAAAVVPEPPALWLATIAVIGLAATCRRTQGW